MARTCPKVNYSHGMEFRVTFWLQSSGRRKESLLAHSDPQGLSCKSRRSWCTYQYPTTHLQSIYHVRTVKAVMTSSLHSPQVSPTPDLHFHEMNEWMLEKGTPMFLSLSMQICLWPADTLTQPSFLPDWVSVLLPQGTATIRTYISFLPIFILLIPFSLIYLAFLLELVKSQGLFSMHPSHRW